MSPDEKDLRETRMGRGPRTAPPHADVSAVPPGNKSDSPPQTESPKATESHSETVVDSTASSIPPNNIAGGEGEGA